MAGSETDIQGSWDGWTVDPLGKGRRDEVGASTKQVQTERKMFQSILHTFDYTFHILSSRVRVTQWKSLHYLWDRTHLGLEDIDLG